MSWEESLQLYEAMISLSPNIERKGKSMPYTSHNGHMFSFLDKEGNMGLRLGNEELEKFIMKFNSKIMEQHGRTMKEFVVIPPQLLKKPKKLYAYFKMSFDYVDSLKPKKSKKSKK